MILESVVIGQRISVRNKLSLVAGTKNFVQFIFEFQDKDVWDDLQILAQFTQNNKSYNRYLESDNSVYLPEWLEGGKCSISLLGVNTENDIIANTDALTFTIAKNPINDESEHSEVSKTIYELFFEDIQNIKNNKEAVAALTQQTSASASNAAASEANALAYKNSAISAQQAASTSESNAKTSETNAKTSEANSKVSETNAKASESSAKSYKDDAYSYMRYTISYTVGTDGEVREGDASDNAKYYYDQVYAIANELGGTLIPKGTISYENLPSTGMKPGHLYNINNAFTSDERFKDGGNKNYPSGTDVYWTADNMWDCLAGGLNELESILREDIADSLQAIADNVSSTSTNADRAETAESNASNSETRAKSSETNAAASEASAKSSETNAKSSETNAYTSEVNAKTSEANASASEANASASEIASKQSEEHAKTSEENAATSESNALIYKNDAQTYAENSLRSSQNASASETNANTYEQNALGYMNEASSSASNASTSESNASKSATEAATSATAAANSAQEASDKVATIVGKYEDSITYANKAESYAVGNGTRTNDNVDNAKYYYEQAKGISQGLNGVLLPMGTVTFEVLIASSPESGYMYNVSNAFTSTSTFKDGGNIKYPAGTNVYYTADGKWDCLSGTTVTSVDGQVGDVVIQSIGDDYIDNLWNS